MTEHRTTVSQGFMDRSDEWTAECSCGWRHETRLPHFEAVAAAAKHHEDGGDQ